MQRLVIAEKPSVAKDIARALGAKDQEPGFYSGDGIMVTWAAGHLVQLMEPEDYDPRYKMWRLSDLPILPQQFRLKERLKQPQLKKLVTLLKRKDIGEVVNACDAGREGELIFRWIMEYSGVSLPCKRLWLSSLTRQAILQAMESLRPAEEYDLLGEAARCRAQSDWLVGINATRALTKKSNSLLSVGRVQTPTLAMIVHREHLVSAFVVQEFYTVVAQLLHANGAFEATWYLPGVKDGSRIWDEATAQSVANTLKKAGTGEVASVVSKIQKRNAPPLYDLTDLQRDMNAKHGFTALKTLQIAQKLYEQYKAITYPRTDSKHISAKTIPLVMVAINAISSRFSSEILALKQMSSGKIPVQRLVNEKDVRDHHAILPTGNTPDLSGENKIVYDAICQRLIAALYPANVREQTEAVIRMSTESLLAVGYKTIDPGWRAIYPADPGTELPQLSVGDEVKLLQASVNKGKTTPPERFSDATLLRAMQNAGQDTDDETVKEAMKDRGLGTPATRAAIIERLIEVGYVERQKRFLVPTPKGKILIDALPARDLVSPDLTGQWEMKLSQIENGQLDPESFMFNMKTFVSTIVSQISEMKPEQIVDEVGPCPRCAGQLQKKSREYKCGACGLSIPCNIAGKEITRQHVEALLTKKKTPVIRGFRSKAGAKFNASLRLTDDLTIKFEFAKPKSRAKKEAGKRPART